MKINFGKVAAVQGSVAEAEVATIDKGDEVVANEVMVEATVETDILVLGWTDLKAVAKELGIKIKGSKEDVQRAVIAALTEEEEAMVIEEVVEVKARSGKVATSSAVVEAEVQTLLKEVELSNNERALEKYIARTKDVIHQSAGHVGYENPILDEVRSQNKALAENYLARIGEYPVEVVGLEYFMRPDAYGRLGKIHLLIPPGMMEIKVWNKENREFEWHEFSGYQLDQFRKRFMPEKGNGLLTLAIKENEKGLFVRLPKTVSKDGKSFYDIVRTKDIRFGKGHTDNNANLEAAASAFLRVLEGEYVLQHPTNRFGFNESCMSCRNLTFMQVKDGVTDDLLEQNSSAVLQQLDIQSLAQYGQLQPQAYCNVYRTFVDQEAVEEANKASQHEKDYYYDADGELRWLAPNEILVGGKAVKTSDVRREGTASICASCPFYHKNEYKGEARIAAEKTKKREEGNPDPYVSPYYTTRAVVERMPVQTLVDEKWQTGFPGEFEGPDAFRVKGLGGVTIYGSEDIMAYANPTFVATMEDIKWAELEINQKINRIYYAAFNLDKLTAEQADEIIEMALNKPADLEDFYAKRWDSAVSWLVQSLEWAADKERTKDAPPYATVFFYKDAPEDAVLIEASELLTNLVYKEVTGMLQVTYNGQIQNPRDLPAKEFAKQLDEEASIDLVYEALLGTHFLVEGKDQAEAELVSESLQVLLQREINNLVYGVRRAPVQAEALAALGVNDDIKAYIKSRL